MISYIWYKVIKKIQGKAVRNSKIDKSSKIEAGSIVIGTTMSKYSFCGYDCKLFDCNIGSFCSIADGVVIGGAAHPLTWVSTSPVFYRGRDSVKKKFSEFPREEKKITEIGNDVWIGERALIKAGVHIGNGAIIGMGSIVTHDVLPYEIVGGNPARHIRFRFPEDTIAKLEKTKWYDWSEDKLAEKSSLIRDVNSFLEDEKL